MSWVRRSFAILLIVIFVILFVAVLVLTQVNSSFAHSGG